VYITGVHQLLANYTCKEWRSISRRLRLKANPSMQSSIKRQVGVRLNRDKYSHIANKHTIRYARVDLPNHIASVMSCDVMWYDETRADLLWKYANRVPYIHLVTWAVTWAVVELLSAVPLNYSPGDSCLVTESITYLKCKLNNICNLKSNWNHWTLLISCPSGHSLDTVSQLAIA